MIKDDNYYIETIKVNEWLVEDLENKRSVIRFANRVEHYLGKELHNEDGAAVTWFLGNIEEYYLFGERFKDKESWREVAIKLSRKEKIISIFSEKE